MRLSYKVKKHQGQPRSLAPTGLKFRLFLLKRNLELLAKVVLS